MESPSKAKRYWRHFCLWFDESVFVAPFMLSYLISGILNIWMPMSNDVTGTNWLNVGVIMGIFLVTYFSLRSLARQEVKLMHQENLENPDYKELVDMIKKLRDGINGPAATSAPPQEEKSEDKIDKNLN